MEPVVGGLWVDALTTCLLSQVHSLAPSREHAYVVEGGLVWEQFATLSIKRPARVDRL